MWDMKSGTLAKVLDGHVGPIKCPAFAPNGMQIAVSTVNGGILIWDAVPEDFIVSSAKRDWIQSTSLPATGVGYSVTFSPDGLWLASAGNTKQVQVWELSSGALLFGFGGHTETVKGVDFSQNGEWLASCSTDRTVRVWNTTASNVQGGSSSCIVAILEEHKGPVWSVVFSSNGLWLASGSDDATVRIWHVSSWTLLVTLRHGWGIWSAVFSPDSTRVASGGLGGELHLWDTKSWARVMILNGHTMYVNCLSFSPDGTRLASGSSDKTVRIWQPTPSPNRNFLAPA
jgi:WD40 repeat protein